MSADDASATCIMACATNSEDPLGSMLAGWNDQQA
jgi:hypothetical protein